MAKARSDSWWAQLTPENRDKAYEHCAALPPGRAIAWLKEEFGVAPSPSAYYRFIEAHAEDYYAAGPYRAHVAQLAVENIAAKFKMSDDVMIAALKAEFAAAQLNPGDPKTLQSLAQTIVSLRRAQIEADKLRLDREKFEAAEKRLAAASAAVADAALTPEEREEKLKEIFGL